MKRQLTHILLSTGLALIGSLTLSAQDQKEVANIPFAFEASHKAMPAGEYTVAETGTRGMFQVSDNAGHALFVMTTLRDQREESNPRLTFRHAGDQYVLAQIATPNGAEYGVSKSSIEKDLNRKLDMAALISVPLSPR
jgi:hypothetical protein